MRNEIRISSLECFGYHGVLSEEKTLGQRFSVSAVIVSDFSKAVQTDDCADTVNYSDVCHKIKDLVENTRFDLIESLAFHVAERLLYEFPLIKRISVEIKKPWAPIGLPLDFVSVLCERAWHEVSLGIGSNMGDSVEIINSAFKILEETESIKDLRMSPLIKTKPYGFKDQPDFVNGAICLKTTMEPGELLDFLHTIENKMHRVREVLWGPRTLDLDILLYDDLISSEKELIIPHPEMHKRDFVLKPLCDVNPNLLHPVFKKRVLDLYNELKSSEDYEENLI